MHRSTYYLPLIRNYEDALRRFKKTKPIRGRNPNDHSYGYKTTPTIPLGRREDVDTYSMLYDEATGNVQLINYRTPLITFTPDNLILITPTWMGLMESGIIERVLDVKAWLDRRKIGVYIGDERHVVGAGNVLVLKSKGDCLSLYKKDTIYSHYINRKQANNVRLRYSQFIKYFEGFLSLRKDTESNGLAMSLMEIADCIGYDKTTGTAYIAGKPTGVSTKWKPDIREVLHIDEKPQGSQCLLPTANRMLDCAQDYAYPSETQWSRYQRQCKRFFALMVDDQPDEVRTENYYRATLTLLALSIGYIYSWPSEGEDKLVVVNTNTALRNFDNFLLQYHSEEMIEKRALKPNQLPNDRYDRFVTIMPTPEQRKNFFSQTQD